MKPETIEKIRKLLTSDNEYAKQRLLECVERGFGGLEERVREYKAAHDALEDFEDWAEEQEDT